MSTTRKFVYTVLAALVFAVLIFPRASNAQESECTGIELKVSSDLASAENHMLVVLSQDAGQGISRQVSIKLDSAQVKHVCLSSDWEDHIWFTLHIGKYHGNEEVWVGDVFLPSFEMGSEGHYYLPEYQAWRNAYGPNPASPTTIPLNLRLEWDGDGSAMVEEVVRGEF